MQEVSKSVHSAPLSCHETSPLLSLLQSESVTHHLKVPVLCHNAFKPAYSCITAIRRYFSSLQSPILDHELVIVGDRVFTDVVLANRMGMQYNRRRQKLLASPGPSQDAEKELSLEASNPEIPVGPLAIWTTGVWQRESMLMRWMERRLVNTVERWSKPPTGKPINVSQFLKEEKIEPFKKSSGLLALLFQLRRG